MGAEANVPFPGIVTVGPDAFTKPSCDDRMIATGSAHAEVVGTEITLVHSPACHFCDDARRALADLAQEYPITVDLVDARDPQGQQLVARHRAPMYPLILVDGAFFSSGRLPRRKLRRLLDTQAVA